jgi:hypothetical protein
LNSWIVRGLLAGLLLFVSEIVLWTDPAGRAPVEWPLLAVGYLALAALLLDFAARYRLRDVFSLLALAGIYGLLNSLALNPQTALADVPRTWATRVLGAHTLVGFGALLLFLLLTSARINRLWLAAPLAGVLWGIWVRGLPAFTDIAAEPATLPVLLIAGGLVLVVVILLNRLAVGRVQRLPDLTLRPVEWLPVSVLLGVLILLNGAHIGMASLLVLLVLAGYCWLLLWFQQRTEGATLLDASMPPKAPSTFALAALAGLYLGAAAIAHSLPFAGDPGPFSLLIGLFAAFGLVWLPTVSLVLGVRSYRRLSRQRRL